MLFYFLCARKCMCGKIPTYGGKDERERGRKRGDVRKNNIASFCWKREKRPGQGQIVRGEVEIGGRKNCTRSSFFFFNIKKMYLLLKL